MIFEPDLLRTFLAFVDGGSLAKAALIVHRSPSAVTVQMQRLEELVGEPLLVAVGRGRTLTPAGEELVGHARRILSAHRDAWLSVKGTRADGSISIGATQDFAESGLPELITMFARTHPRVRLDLRIGRSGEIAEAFETEAIDVVVTLGSQFERDVVGTIVEPMEWMVAEGGLIAASEPMPLALLDAPCGFRSAALTALDDQERGYRIVATSSSLAGLRAAVQAGIAVSVRTPRWSGRGITFAPPSLGLPPLGEAIFAIRLRPAAHQAATDFAALICDGLNAERVR